MYNTSTQFLKASRNKARELVSKLIIKTVDQTWELNPNDIMGGSISISSACMNKGFELGAVTASSLTVSLRNNEGQWNGIELEGASVYPYCGYVLSGGTTEYVPMGVFVVDQPSRPYGTLELKAADRLIFLDEPLSALAVTYPISQMLLLNAISTYCNVPLTPGINAMPDINQQLTMPTNKDMTCRDAVSEIALMHSGFARMNRYGQLEIVPLDNPATKRTTVDHVNSHYENDTIAEVDEDIGHLTIDELFVELQGLTIHVLTSKDRQNFKETSDAIKITGLLYDDQLWGEEGYVIEIKKLELLDETDALTVIDRVWEGIEGYGYVAYDAEYYGNPALEIGDPVLHQARDGRVVRSFIGKHVYKHGGSCKMQAEGESRAAVNYKTANARRLSQLAGEVTRNLEKKLLNYQLASAQLSDMMSRMIGVYETTDILEDGSSVYYKHNKPLLSESDVIWRFDGGALTFSSDGGLTWGGMTADSNLIIKNISTIGMNADWVQTGSLSGGKIIFDLDNGTFLIGNSSTNYNMYFDGTDLKLGGTTSLSWGNITGKPSIPSVPGYITSTKITATTIESPTIIGNAGQIANFVIREAHIGANATDGSWWYIATYGATHPTTGAALNHLIRMHDGADNPLFGISKQGEVTAKSFVNLTPAYTGNALEEISRIRADSKGGIDHSTLPEFAQAKVEKMTNPNVEKSKGRQQTTSAYEPEYIEGQDIGAMVSVLTKAVQELIAKNEEQDAAISALEQRKG